MKRKLVVRKATKAKKPTSSKKVVSVPYSVGTVTTCAGPGFTGSGSSCRLSHRELVTSVSTVAFNQYQPEGWIINPGRTMFPWLSQIAPCFEKYTINSLTFEYVPVVAVSTPGHLRMYIDYDPMDEVPNTPREFAMMYGTVTTPIWSRASLRYQAPKSSLFTALHGATEDRLSDAGTLYFYSESTAAVYAGELWVDYDITLIKPQASNQTQVAVGGDEPLTRPVDQCPGPDSGEYHITPGVGMAAIRDSVNLASQVGMIYDQVNRVLSNPASAGRMKRRVIVNATGDAAISNGGASWTHAADLLTASAPVNCTLDGLGDVLNYITDTTAPPWNLQAAFDVTNAYDSAPGTLKLQWLDALGKVPAMAGHLKTVITVLNDVTA